MLGRILITGGAGFIGSHVADELLSRGYQVRVLDSLVSQVHGASRARPDYLHPDVDLVRGDIRDASAIHAALAGVDAVFHFAAAVGVGQSMYRIADYTEVNELGTARLLEALAARPVERLVVASSMSVYGEGLYRDERERAVEDVRRDPNAAARGQFEPLAADGRRVVPAATPETKRPCLESIYALGKYQQEQSCLLVGRAYGMTTTALRFFNVYGPRQALSNPYTGVLAIFASRFLNGRQPLVFEDGLQKRDFVSVHDVARACLLALESSAADGEVLNIGSGRAQTVLEVAEQMARALSSKLEPEITGQVRAGDIRHCYADIGRARAVLGYQPEVGFEDGLIELAGWLASQMATDRVDTAHRELTQRGLAR